MTTYRDLSEEALLFEEKSIFVEFLVEVLVADLQEEEMLATYPNFTREELYACLIYATHPLKNESSSERFPILTVS